MNQLRLEMLFSPMKEFIDHSFPFPLWAREEQVYQQMGNGALVMDPFTKSYTIYSIYLLFYLIGNNPRNAKDAYIIDI